MSRINLYTEVPDKSGLSSDDYLVIDGTTNGTRRIKAKSLIALDSTDSASLKALISAASLWTSDYARPSGGTWSVNRDMIVEPTKALARVNDFVYFSVTDSLYRIIRIYSSGSSTMMELSQICRFEIGEGEIDESMLDENLSDKINDAVQKTREVAGKPLSEDITAEDISEAIGFDMEARYMKLVSVDSTTVNSADDRTVRYWWSGKGFVYFPCYDNVTVGSSVCQYLMDNSGQLKVRKGIKTGNHTYSWDPEWTVIGENDDAENAVVKGLRNLIPDSTYSGENQKVSTYLNHAAYSASDYTNTSIPSSIGSVPYHYDIPDGFNVSVSAEGRAIEVYDSISGTVYQTSATPSSNYIIRNLIPGHLCTYNVLDQNGYVIQYGSIKDVARVRMIYPGFNNEQTDPYNIRDLGGWSCDGGRLKYGVIYRGSELFSVIDRSDGTTFTPNVSLSDAQKKFFISFLGIKDEIDFHQRGTMDSKGAQLASDVGYLNVVLNHYQNIFRNEKVKVRTIITRIADDIRAGKPVYMHCQAGADRTAVISMILEALCGVSQSDCDTDYELSSYSCRYNIPVDISQSGSWQANRRVRNTGAGYASWREMMTGFVGALSGSTLKDKIIGYLLTIGVTIDDINDIRHGLIDGEPTVLTAEDFAGITGASEYTITINTNGNVYINEALPAQQSVVMNASAYSPFTIKLSRVYANYELDTLTVNVSNYIPTTNIVSNPCGNDPYFNPGTGVLTIPSVTGPVTINVSAVNRFSKRPEVWQTASSSINNPDGDNTYDLNGTTLASIPMYSFVWHTGLKRLFKETSRSGTVSTLSPVYGSTFNVIIDQLTVSSGQYRSSLTCAQYLDYYQNGIPIMCVFYDGSHYRFSTVVDVSKSPYTNEYYIYAACFEGISNSTFLHNTLSAESVSGDGTNPLFSLDNGLIEFMEKAEIDSNLALKLDGENGSVSVNAPEYWSGSTPATPMMTGAYQLEGEYCTVTCTAKMVQGWLYVFYRLPLVPLSDVMTSIISDGIEYVVKTDTINSINCVNIYRKDGQNHASANDVPFTIRYRYSTNGLVHSGYTQAEVNNMINNREDEIARLLAEI